MLLSRFWYLILSAAATAGLMAAMLAANLVNEGHRATVEDELRRDRFEVEAILKLDARARIDAIAPIAANPDVRSALRQASARRAGEAVPDEVKTRLTTKLSELNQQLAGFRGDLVFAVDANGWIVASVAPGRIPPGAGLGQFPLVARALEGYMRDDVWVYNDGIYRMAARPVIEGGQYVGALIHGKRFDDELAQLVSTRLDGATVGFFRGEQMVAGYMPADVQAAPRRDEVGAPLANGLLNDEHLARGERTEPQSLTTGGLAVYSLVTGTAREANVGYAIARPLPAALGPLDLVTHASGESWTQVVQVYWVWGVFAGLLLFAIFVVWLERDRPLGKLRRAMSGLTSSPEARLTVTDFGGQYRKIAQHANDALDHVAQAGGGAPTGKRKAAANLDEILGPAEAAPSSSFFGFQQQEQGGPDLPDVPASKPATSPAVAAPAIDPPRPPAPAAKPPPPKPPAPPPPGKRVTPPPAQPAAEAPAPPAPEPEKPAAPPAAAAPDSESATRPPASQRKQLKRTLLGVPPPADDDDDDDGATMVARVPEELLAQSASLPTAGGGDDEEAHFREVFKSFLDTKKQCGEPTAGLTFEKFVVTLRKNRDQIVSRHGARKVRFTVYVKNGKAALKATPIRE